jgi:protein arginine kinase
MSGESATAFSTAAVKRGAEWLRGLGSHSDVVVSSRVRLARNLAGAPFLTRASRQHRQAIVDLCRDRLLTSGVAAQMVWVDVHTAPQLDRTLMVERHLISKEHARGLTLQPVPGGGTIIAPAPKPEPLEATGDAGPAAGEPGGPATPAGAQLPRGVAISIPDETLSVMVNEEDHLRLQVLRSGLELSAAFEYITRVDDLLEGVCSAGPMCGARLEYAFNPRFGYLTACPTNVGTGIRVSVMLHLPGLKLIGEMDKVRRATRDMNLAVRGYYGEGSEAAGEFYQISNQTTLGKSEEDLLREFERDIIPQVIKYERESRRKLLETRRRLIEDKVFRALGTLRHARLLTPEESIALLSDVRLGIVTGLVRDVSEQDVNQLILLTQPAHLQRVLGREMDQGQRREARADMVRQKLAI